MSWAKDVLTPVYDDAKSRCSPLEIDIAFPRTRHNKYGEPCNVEKKGKLVNILARRARVTPPIAAALGRREYLITPRRVYFLVVKCTSACTHTHTYTQIDTHTRENRSGRPRFCGEMRRCSFASFPVYKRTRFIVSGKHGRPVKTAVALPRETSKSHEVNTTAPRATAERRHGM